MFILLQHLKRFLFLESEPVGSFLKLPVLLGLVMLLAVEIGAIYLSAFQRGMMGHL